MGRQGVRSEWRDVPASVRDRIVPAGVVCVVDADSRFLYVSRSFERILGYSREEVIGHLAFDFLHEDDRSATSR